MEYNCFCSYCKNQLYRKPSYLKRYSKVFCGKTCQTANEKDQSKKVQVNCSHCSKEISKTQSQLRASKTGLSFCDNQCKNTYISRNSRWSGNPFDYRSRKKYLIEHSGKACQNCSYNEDERMLDVHHNDGDHQNNDWSNLRVVCVWCHQKHHRCNELLVLPPLVDTDGKRIKDSV